MGEKFQRIVFFNYYHYGDIHQSRSFIRWMVSKELGEKYYISQRMKNHVLQDIPELEMVDFSFVEEKGLSHDSESRVIDGDLFINTWVGQRKALCTLDSHRGLFSDVLRKFVGIDLDSDKTYLPLIDYEYYDIDKARDFMTRRNRPAVLIVNGDVLSGQSVNFSFNPVVEKLATYNEDVDFYLTDETSRIEGFENVFYTRDVIGKDGCDLNENAFIGENSNLVVGRSSGVYTYVIGEKTVNDHIFSLLCFSHNSEDEALFTKLWKGNAKKYGSNLAEDEIRENIQIEITRIKGA